MMDGSGDGYTPMGGTRDQVFSHTECRMGGEYVTIGGSGDRAFSHTKCRMGDEYTTMDGSGDRGSIHTVHRWYGGLAKRAGVGVAIMDTSRRLGSGSFGERLVSGSFGVVGCGIFCGVRAWV